METSYQEFSRFADNNRKQILFKIIKNKRGKGKIKTIKKINKKAQTEQIFFYIFAIIVTAVILFLGMKAIGYTKTIGSQVDLARFITDVNNGAQKNFDLGTGSLTKIDLYNPLGTKIICFLNPKENIDFSIIKDSKLQQEISSLSKLKDSNMYIGVENELKAYNIENVKAKNGIQCKQEPFSGLSLIFENKGLYSEVEIK